MKSGKKNFFFIVGTQRSGTTLLRLILNAHSQVAIPEEAGFLRPLLRTKFCNHLIGGEKYQKLVSYLKNNGQYKLWNYDRSEFFHFLEQRGSIHLKDLIEQLFFSYCSSEGKSIWGDKTPVFWRNINMLRSLFPDAVFIHIVRDGRDVFDSWRKMDATKNNVAVTALDWCIKLHTIQASFEKIRPENRIIIRYEDIISQPEMIIRQLCEKIGIPFEREMLSFYTRSDRYIGSHHSRLIFKPLDPKNSQKWKQTLTNRELAVYNLIAGRLLRKHGYECQKSSKRVYDFFQAGLLLAYGLPQKAVHAFAARRNVELALKKGLAPKIAQIGEMPYKRYDE